MSLADVSGLSAAEITKRLKAEPLPEGAAALGALLEGALPYATLQGLGVIALRALIASGRSLESAKGESELTNLSKADALVLAMTEGYPAGWVALFGRGARSVGDASSALEQRSAGPAPRHAGPAQRQGVTQARTPDPLQAHAAPSDLLGPGDRDRAAQLTAAGLAAGAEYTGNAFRGAERSESKQPPADEAARRFAKNTVRA